MRFGAQGALMRKLGHLVISVVRFVSELLLQNSKRF